MTPYLTAVLYEAQMGRRRFVYSAEGKVSPERFIAALVDFSDHRPKYWPGQTRNQFRLIEQGKDWALVREGTLTVWEQSRYDWSKLGRVVSTVEDSNFLKPGTTWAFHVTKRANGGCRVDVVLERDFTGWQGNIVEGLSRLPGSTSVFERVLRQTMGILEREEPR